MQLLKTIAFLTIFTTFPLIHNLMQCYLTSILIGPLKSMCSMQLNEKNIA